MWRENVCEKTECFSYIIYAQGTWLSVFMNLFNSISTILVFRFSVAVVEVAGGDKIVS